MFRAVLLLTPLFGVHYVVSIFASGAACANALLSSYIAWGCISSQGIFVSLVLCYCNGEVQFQLKRSYARYVDECIYMAHVYNLPETENELLMLKFRSLASWTIGGSICVYLWWIVCAAYLILIHSERYRFVEGHSFELVGSKPHKNVRYHGDARMSMLTVHSDISSGLLHRTSLP